MFVIDFINAVREAQGYPGISALPYDPAGDATPFEVAMGCRIDGESMRFADGDAARSVALATGLERRDEVTVEIPPGLGTLSHEWADHPSGPRPLVAAV